MFGTAWRSAASRSHGSSERKRSATSYVAPPQHSSDHSCGVRPGDVARDREQVAGADPGREQRLVGVAEGGVGDRDGRLRAQPAGELLGAELEQQLAGAVGRRHVEVDARAAWSPGRASTGASPCGWLTVTSAR